ncbi:hypothetical protein MMC07_002571 [Pseudocyphellaria aurata]|nr:hypothetical protein [Pseudocyphellaria aurata]
MHHELIQRDCRAKPSKLALLPREIDIYHPGYEDELVRLLALSGYDSKEGDLWYGFAHTACAIISNNQFDGWLSTSRNPQSPRFSGELLAPGDYWWHLPGDSAQPYAIITDFRNWRLPQSIPEDWRSQAQVREQAETTCQVSQEYHTLNKAYIVPSSETEWFDRCGLGFSYGSNACNLHCTALEQGIDNDNNLILLRSDLHHAWDQRHFTFVPKRTKEGLRIVIHCWDETMVTGYHNVPLQGFVGRELLLARFAWTMLPRALESFLKTAKVSRMIWTRDDHGKLIARSETAKQCLFIANALASQTDGQSVMTSRRNGTERSYRSTDSGLGLKETDDDDDHDEDHSEDDDSDDDSQSEVDPEELARGRKRFRAGDDWYPVLGV